VFVSSAGESCLKALLLPSSHFAASVFLYLFRLELYLVWFFFIFSILFFPFFLNIAPYDCAILSSNDRYDSATCFFFSFSFSFSFPFVFVPRNGKGKSDYGAGIIAFRSARVRFFLFKGGELVFRVRERVFAFEKRLWSAWDVREASDEVRGGGGMRDG